MNLLLPWKLIADDSVAKAVESEFRSEVGDKHQMFGLVVKAIGYRIDCDEFLFKVMDDSGRLAVVHLTYASRPEPDPRWPHTEIFESWDDFVERRMSLDNDDWI